MKRRFKHSLVGAGIFAAVNLPAAHGEELRASRAHDNLVWAFQQVTGPSAPPVDEKLRRALNAAVDGIRWAYMPSLKNYQADLKRARRDVFKAVAKRIVTAKFFQTPKLTEACRGLVLNLGIEVFNGNEVEIRGVAEIGYYQVFTSMAPEKKLYKYFTWEPYDRPRAHTAGHKNSLLGEYSIHEKPVRVTAILPPKAAEADVYTDGPMHFGDEELDEGFRTAKPNARIFVTDEAAEAGAQRCWNVAKIAQTKLAGRLPLPHQLPDVLTSNSIAYYIEAKPQAGHLPYRIMQPDVLDP